MPEPILVAVIEDDPFFRDSMRRLVRSWGYRVEAFRPRPSSSRLLISANPLA